MEFSLAESRSRYVLKDEKIRTIQNIVKRFESDDEILRHLNAICDDTDLNVKVEALGTAANQGKVSLIKRLIQEGVSGNSEGVGVSIQRAHLSTE